MFPRTKFTSANTAAHQNKTRGWLCLAKSAQQTLVSNKACSNSIFLWFRRTIHRLGQLFGWSILNSHTGAPHSRGSFSQTLSTLCTFIQVLREALAIFVRMQTVHDYGRFIIWLDLPSWSRKISGYLLHEHFQTCIDFYVKWRFAFL